MIEHPRRLSALGAFLFIAALAPTRVAAQPANVAAGHGDWVYAVRPGDTLWAIGRAHLIRPDDWPQVQRLNRLTSDRLVPGMRLRIPFDLMRLRPVPARVLAARGDAHVLRAGGQRATLAPDRLIYAGDAIDTGPDGSATVAFADESTMLIGPSTRVAFDLLASLVRRAWWTRGCASIAAAYDPA